MADVSRSVYLSKKLSSLNDETSRHIYDGMFSSPAPTKLSSRIDDYREIFPPSSASLGSSIPILDLPAVDRSRKEVDYAGVFGGFGDSDGIGPPPEQLLRDVKKIAKRGAQPPRSPVQMGRIPPKSQEFPCNYGNDQASTPAQTMRMPSKSQEFSRNYGSDQTSGPAPTRRMPSKSQEFSGNYGNDQTSTPAQTMRMPSKSQEFPVNYGDDQRSNPVETRRMPSKSQEFSGNYGNDQSHQTATPAQTMRMPSKSQEFPVNYGDDQRSNPVETRRMPSKSQEFSGNYGNDQSHQTSTPAQTMRMPSKSQEFSVNYGDDQRSNMVQTRRMPSKSQEFSGNYGNDQAPSPAQTTRMPSKSQEFSCNNGNDQTPSLAQTRMQHSKSQEFSRHFSDNQIATSPQTRSPFSRGDERSGSSSNDQTSAGALPHQTVSVSYNETKQLSKDGTSGTTHIAHLHAVPGYTLLFDEAGPVRKAGFIKAKRLSMNDADFSSDVGEVLRQGKHTRAVSDLGTNKQASDNNPGFQESFGGGNSHFVASHGKRESSSKPRTRSVSLSNSPQSFAGSDYFKRSASRRSIGSTNNQTKNAVDDSFPLLDEEFDVNSDAAVSAAAMERAIEEAEEKIRWAKEFLMGLESIGFIKPTLKDSFRVKATTDSCHSCETDAPNQNGGLKAARKKKCINEAGGTTLKDDLDTNESQLEKLKKGLRGVAGNLLSMDPTMRRPSAPETLEETPESFQQSDFVNEGLADNTNAREESKLAEENCKHEGGGEWETAKHLSQLLTGVKNRLVNFISKQAEVEKTVVPKEAPSKCESLEQSEERAFEVRNGDTNQERGADLGHIEEKVEMNHSTCSEAGESAHDSIRKIIDMEICVEENEVNKSDATSSVDVEILTSQQCGPSESEETSEYIEAQETADSAKELNQDVHTEVKGEVLQEVQEQNQELLDANMKTEDGSHKDTVELEEWDEIPENACESRTCDDKGTNWEDEERVKKVEGLELGKEVDEPVNNEAVNGRQIEDCSLKEIETPKDAQTQQEHVGMVEETCAVEEHYERVVEAKVINAEGVTGKDITSEATGGLTEVFGDVSEHDEHLAVADAATEQDESFLSKTEEASMPDEIQYAPGVGFPPEEKGSMTGFPPEEKESMTESATAHFEPKQDIKQSESVQRANEIFKEGICEETLCSIEVVDDDSELDEYLPAVDDISEQDEFLSPRTNEEAIVHDKEGLTEATFTTFEPDGTGEKSKSVQMAGCEANGQYRSEDSGSHSEAADRSLEQDDYLPGADRSYEHENQYVQEVKVADEEKITGEGTSEFEQTEQPSPTQKRNELNGEEMADVSMSDGDIFDLDKIEKEGVEAHKARPCTDDEITEGVEAHKDRPCTDDEITEGVEAHKDRPCADDEITEGDTVSKSVQKHSDEETRNIATDIGSDNKDDESDVSTRDGANQANEQDVSSHIGESSHKRRRWFDVGDFQLPGFFQRFEKAMEMPQKNAEGLKIEERAEICVDETLNESGDSVHLEQVDAGSGQDLDDEGLNSTEGTHRRRRWFDNIGEQVQLKPIPFNGVEVAAGMDHEIAQEAKQDVSSQSDVDKLTNERKDGADGMDINMSNDEVERRASTEEGNRRRRWFENGEKYGPAQRPGPAILEDNEVTAELEEEIEMRADTAKHELREASTSEDLASTNQREEQSKEREKEKEKLAVERAMREARQRAFVEARERAAAEARLKAAAAAQDRQGKASSEAKPSSDKASMDAKYKAERAAVERATAEARERALQKAMSREKDGKNQNSGPSSSSGYSTSVPFTSSSRSNGTATESPQRRKAISERNKRTTERAAKALEEKNMRDLLVQKEQAEKNRFATAFDAEVKRWSSGKEGNLRSLLSTLQYILGPESGWQPIPLTDLVTPTAVRKAYKRAALCVHPDKLQQRGATIQQKYICEKVFDLLKDGWHKFNRDDR